MTSRRKEYNNDEILTKTRKFLKVQSHKYYKAKGANFGINNCK